MTSFVVRKASGEMLKLRLVPVMPGVIRGGGVVKLERLLQLRLGQNYLLLQRSFGKTLSIGLSKLLLLQTNIPHLRLRRKYLRRLQGGIASGKYRSKA